MTLDVAALTPYLAKVCPPAGRPISAALIIGGRSNLTYEVTVGDRALVLRRPPLGHMKATAHDMRREARVIKALAGTAVPVPTVVAECDDPAVLGAPFYIMEKVAGRVYRTEKDLAEIAGPRAERAAHNLIDTLAELHSIDPAAVGLGDFGRPEGYLGRQVNRWRGQVTGSEELQEFPGMTALADGLLKVVPETGRAGIVHGDYRLDNAILDAADPGRIRAVLDWEMATLGDPLADLGLFHIYWVGWERVGDGVAAAPGAVAGFPSWDTLAERYTRKSGYALDDLDFHIALAYFKLAVILGGIHGRHKRGLTVGEGFDGIGEMVPVLVERGLAVLPV
ncbi:phosphotransferase family protein [Sinosporangium siamense]|uniref:Acyl-CoA dehydrogenase n=1 Tax=Sinosporangium siamense TaxID=1367973 RepID=A0A919RFT2_9ACTN|nr:phosphotransferase family protein [Sinosporangium siamense]GII92828.1 acyl-CoA dehydrogenase [Sinosporangium siamense]